MKMSGRSISVRSLNARLSDQERASNGITVKSQRELDRMLDAGASRAWPWSSCGQSIAAGMTTQELDAIAESEIRALGGIPAFKGYRGFPATLCVSVNDEIVHGIPGGRVIREGDVIGLDLGAIVDGLYGDSAVTVAVGAVPEATAYQMETGRAALVAGIAQVRAGNRIGDVSAAVQTEVERRGTYGIVREYVGHGIGRKLHEEPQVPNYGVAGQGAPAPARHGDCNRADGELRDARHPASWTTTGPVVTADGSTSVHYEHTVVVTEGDPVVTTQVD